MPKTPKAQPLGEPTLDAMRARPPETVDEDWKDDIVDRLLRELKRQLIQLENTKPTPEIDQAKIRAANVATLAAIERTLERLLQVSEQRALKSETRKAANDDEALKELERRIDLLAAAARTPNDPAGSQS